MKKSMEFELRKKCGDLNAICGFKDYVFNDGTARGIRAFDLKNGKGLEMTVLADRGLDIPYLSYKGVNIGLNNKVGLRSPHMYTENGGAGFLRQFFGGLLTTCGLTYAGAAGVDEGISLGLHGPFNNAPADKVCAVSESDNDDVVLRVSGDIRESVVFGENMVMHRTLRMETERNCIHICDTVENQAYATTPLMLVYHVNFGYPMLDDGAKVYCSATKVEPRTKFAAEDMDKYDLMEAPGIGREEQCYFHTEQPDGADAFAMLHNEQLGLAVIMHYDKRVFPLLCEWKCMRAGDYALGLEPTTSGVDNRSVARENGMLTYLEPGESREFKISLEITEDVALIESYKARAHRAKV